MNVIKARNVHEALPEALHQLSFLGVGRSSRNGSVLMFPEPVTTVFLCPAERVVFWPERDANPFFHLMESLWMLGGRNDVDFVARYVERMRSFSDDGEIFHGAYGYRWRHHFNQDQLRSIITALRANPDDRRQVLSMWDARVDLGRDGKDLPCNLQAIFQIACDGRLDMTVTNRSNDIIWGAYGANAVHFSYLHEFVARSLGVAQGCYYQVSANFHAYCDVLGKVAPLAGRAGDPMLPPHLRWAGLDPYADEQVAPFPLMSTDPETWLRDLERFFQEDEKIPHRCSSAFFEDPFFSRVAAPMRDAHLAYKETKGPERFEAALAELAYCEATDWRRAAIEWVARRRKNAEERARRAADDGVCYE